MRHLKNLSKTSVTCLIFVFLLCINGFTETGTGMEKMILQGGALGEVPFPHHRHQQVDPPNCQKCHALFPQVENSIALGKQDGKLESRQVMDELCIKCHQETANAGKPSGPRSCTVCHIRISSRS